jgi:hypothetical protein
MTTPTTRLMALGLIAAGLATGAAVAGDSPRDDRGRPGHLLKADTDGDGRVSRAEATASGSDRASVWFDKLDTDKDGYVTTEEIKQARETRKHDFKEKAEERFKAADMNGDGQLSLDEVQAKNPKMAERFAELDKDKNGYLTPSEMARPRHKPAT